MPKLYTKAGDKGTTSLYDRSIVEKTSVIISTLGDIDELSSHIGLLFSFINRSSTDKIELQSLRKIQLLLVDISSLIATINRTNTFNMKENFTTEVVWIEKKIDLLTKQVAPLREFLLTGVSECDSQSNICRSVCRRAERSLWLIQKDYKTLLHDTVYIFMNRLSDYFFAVARVVCPEEIKVSDLRFSLENLDVISENVEIETSDHSVRP